jgi:hypothetical protein
MAYKSTINTGLPNIPEVPDPRFLAEFVRVYNAIRNLTIAVDAYAGAQAQEAEFYSQTPATQTLLSQNVLRLYVPFTVTMTLGQTVNLHDTGSALGARLASAAAAGTQMHGWVSIAATAGNYGEVMLGGLCNLIGGLTRGTTYYLGNTAGTIANSAGVVSQRVGYAIGTSQIFMQPQLI